MDEGSMIITGERHETVSVFSKKKPNYFPQKTKGAPYRFTRAAPGEVIRDKSVAGWVTENKGDRFPLSYQKINSEAGFHPTQKPVALCEYLIKTHCPAGGIVLDPFAGSGSTGVASKKLGFGFVGIEMNAEYSKIMRRRIREVEAA